MIDIRQTEDYARYLRTEGWIVERIERVNYFLKKLPLVGYVLKVQRPEKLDFDTINKLCRKYHVFQVIIEPDLSLVNSAVTHKSIINQGYKLSKSPYLPSKTLQINLLLSMDRSIDSMKKDARLEIRKFKNNWGSEKRMGRKGYIKEYSTPNEIRIFREAWKKSVNFNRYVPSADSLINLRKSFPSNHSLILASHNITGSIIGGVIFTVSSHGVSNYITYYWYGFTNSEGRTSLSQYSLLYQGILWAKKIGCKVFDFEGVYDPRFPNKSWLGFSHFKRSFGGTEVLFPGCYTQFRLSL